MIRLAKRLKKEKVNMDIVNFGEDVRIIIISCVVRGYMGLNNAHLCWKYVW